MSGGLNLGGIKSATVPEVGAGKPPEITPTAIQTAPEEEVAVEAEPEEEIVTYTCYPLARFNVGPRWKFENSTLKLDLEESEKFDRYLKDKKTDAKTKNLVRKIDRSAAEAFVAAIRQPVASKRIDSSTAVENRQVTDLGTKELGSN